MTPSDAALAEGLKQRFQLTFRSLEQDALVARSRAIVGTDQLPATPQGQLALSGLQKLKTGADPGPTPAEFAALEYMIRAMRPAEFVDHGAVQPLADPDAAAAFSHWTGFSVLFPSIANSIGRIARVTSGSPNKYDPQGTGFLIAPGVLMTNTHVLDAVSNGVRELEPGQACVEFRAEANAFDPEPKYTLDRVLNVHDTLDVCLLSVADAPANPALNLATLRPDAMAQVAAVGFPYPDQQRDPLFIYAVFGNKFGFKRVSPGLVTGFQDRTATLYHDCCTLGGNSGSPILSLADGAVVGLHRGGGFLWKNLAVVSTEMRDWALETAAHA